MKNLFLSFAFLFIGILAQGQVEFYGEDIPEDLKETKLAAVMSGSEAYQVQLKNAVEQHWDLNEVEFIDESTFEEYKSNSDYSFLYVQMGAANGLPTDFFTLAIGNKKKSEQPLILKEIIIDLKGINGDKAPFVHLYVQQMQQYIKAVAAREVTDIPSSEKMVSDETYRVKEMPLLVTESDFDRTLEDPEKRSEFYHGEMEVVDQDRKNEAILENESVAVVDIVLTGERRTMHCYKRVYDASTGELLYQKDTPSLYGKKQGLIEDDLKALDWAR